jgi:hypothetical protein
MQVHQPRVRDPGWRDRQDSAGGHMTLTWDPKPRCSACLYVLPCRCAKGAETIAAREARRDAIRSVGCPHCGANAGRSCTTPSGHTAGDGRMHAARLERASGQGLVSL